MRTYFLGPMASYNLSIADNVSLKPYAKFGLGAMNDETPSYTSDSSGFSFVLGGNICFFLNDFISLNAGMGYTYLSVSDDDNDLDTKASEFGFDLGLSVYIK